MEFPRIERLPRYVVDIVRVPEPHCAMGSIEFSKFLLQEAKVASEANG